MIIAQLVAGEVPCCLNAQVLEEMKATRADLKAAENRISSFDALAKKAASMFEARLGAVERERDQLLEQVMPARTYTYHCLQPLLRLSMGRHGGKLAKKK